MTYVQQWNGSAGKGPATLPKETSFCKQESITDGCSEELRMFEEAEFRDTKEGSNPIRKPSRMPEITYATADLSG